jgi:hypothetical protein
MMTESPSHAHFESQENGSGPRRNSRSWTFFRLALGLGGAALVLLPVASVNSYIFSIAGMFMFVAAILLAPLKPRTTLREKARELGARVVVDGGRYHLAKSSSFVPVHLFIAADRISAFDAKFRLLLEIPTAEITSFLALQADKGWFLEVIWSTNAAEFSYRGAYAERLAVAAEDAIRSVAPATVPPTAQRRAAGA